MGARSTLYSINLMDFENIDPQEAQLYVDLAKKDISARYESVKEYDVRVLRHIFGLQRIEGDPSRTVLVPMGWICENFGTQIFWEELPPIYELETYSPLEDYAPPFGLPKGDESVAHMNLQSIRSERERLEGCDQESLDYEGAEIILAYRKKFLEAHDFCINRSTDMILIQS